MKATHTPPTTTADVAPTPADILRGAALYITRHGWTQGTYFSDPDAGLPTAGKPYHPTLTPPACALGALAMAAFGQRFPEAAYERPEWCDYKDAENALTVYLDCAYPAAPDDEYPEPGIGEWNDQPDRTAEQVITALREAADRWEHPHTQAGACA